MLIKRPSKVNFLGDLIEAKWSWRKTPCRINTVSRPSSSWNCRPSSPHILYTNPWTENIWISWRKKFWVASRQMIWTEGTENRRKGRRPMIWTVWNFEFGQSTTALLIKHRVAKTDLAWTQRIEGLWAISSCQVKISRICWIRPLRKKSMAFCQNLWWNSEKCSSGKDRSKLRGWMQSSQFWSTASKIKISGTYLTSLSSNSALSK